MVFIYVYLYCIIYNIPLKYLICKNYPHSSLFTLIYFYAYLKLRKIFFTKLSNKKRAVYEYKDKHGKFTYNKFI